MVFNTVECVALRAGAEMLVDVVSERYEVDPFWCHSNPTAAVVFEVFAFWI
jgi:hypothetical protein